MRLFLPLAAAAFASTALAEDSVKDSEKNAALIKLPSSPVALYEGTAISKSSGQDSSVLRNRVTLIQVAQENEPDTPRLLVVRFLEQEGAENRIVGFDKVAVLGTAASQAQGAGSASGSSRPRLEALDDPPLELEMSYSLLNEFLPVDLLPAFSWPSPKGEASSEATVSVLGLAEVKLPFSVSAKQEEGQIEIVRTLKEGSSPAFSLNDQRVSVAIWRERYVVDSKTGALTHLDHAVAVESKGEDGAQRYEKTLTLDSKKTEPPSGDASKSGALTKELEGILADFRSVKPSKEISGRIEGFGKLAKGSAFEPIARALGTRLAAFRSFFEESDEGKELAKMLGKQAPDFKLKGLDGKEVSFRETMKDKVTLLCFWGVG